MLYQILLSNLHILKLALSPGDLPEVQPRLVRIRTGLKTDFAKWFLANSITLTPGTITIDIDGDELLIHSISEVTTTGVEDDAMESGKSPRFSKGGTTKDGELFCIGGDRHLRPHAAYPLPDYCGPTAIDRIVAVNVIGTKTTVLLVIIGMIFERVGMFVDFALTYALLNFIGSLAAALLRSRQSGKTLHAVRNQGARTMILNIICIALVVTGIIFFVGGAVGIVRFPDFYTRMHAAGRGYDVGLPRAYRARSLPTLQISTWRTCLSREKSFS